MKKFFPVVALAALALCAVVGAAHAVDLAAPALLAGLLNDPAPLLMLAAAPAGVVAAEGVLSDSAGEVAAAATAEADAAAQAAGAAKAGGAKKLKARVLFAGAFGKVDAVVSVDPVTAKAGVAAGELDTDKGAVAYAESLAAAK